ncbi:MAG: putative rane protein [Thermoplasmata archaeon]|jgi:putative membrane protein|nr:putative rane protein [Thermoplasmata archaeon]
MSGRRRAIATLWTLFALLWVAMAIAPLDRGDWLLENLLVFLGVPAFWLLHRRVPLSLGSHALVVAFLSLHVVGAHWSYARVPIDWAALGFERNHYDRVVHFAYGLLLAPPILEWLERTGRGKGLWGAGLAVQAILASSALYEIVEWLTAIVVAPDLGAAFLGTQGDEFDAVTDMALAGLGAVVAMGAWVVARRVRSP